MSQLDGSVTKASYAYLALARGWAEIEGPARVHTSVWCRVPYTPPHPAPCSLPSLHALNHI